MMNRADFREQSPALNNAEVNRMAGSWPKAQVDAERKRIARVKTQTFEERSGDTSAVVTLSSADAALTRELIQTAIASMQEAREMASYTRASAQLQRQMQAYIESAEALLARIT